MAEYESSGGRPKNQITLEGLFRPSQLNNDAEILTFDLNLGVFQLSFRIPIPDEDSGDKVPVYVRYRIGGSKPNGAPGPGPRRRRSVDDVEIERGRDNGRDRDTE